MLVYVKYLNIKTVQVYNYRMGPELQTHINSQLSQEYDSIVQSIKPLLTEADDYSSKAEELTTQFKFHVSDATEVKNRLQTLGAVMVVGPVEQYDEYYLQEGHIPSFTTESLCLRTQKPYVDYRSSEPTSMPDTYSLIYKTNPHTSGSSHTRTVKSMSTHDGDVALGMIDAVHTISQHNLTTSTVSKTRKQYLFTFPGTEQTLHMNVDESVILGDRDTSGQLHTYPVGSYIELNPKGLKDSQLTSIVEFLQLDSHPYDVPYISKSEFIGKLVTLKQAAIEFAPNNDSTAEWLGSSNKPLYYDALKNEFIIGLDPDKIKNYRNDLLQKLLDEVHKICSTLDDTSDGVDIISHKGGKKAGC